MGIDKIERRKAVFLDRDGVLNRNVFNPSSGQFESPRRPEEVEMAPDVAESLRILRNLGFMLFVVSNQPNYAKGKSPLEQLWAVHEILAKHIANAGVEISEFFYCFHHPDGIVDGYSGPCECRKPSPYFLQLASARFGIDLSKSWMLGDRATDIEFGRLGGTKTIRIKEDHPAVGRSSTEPAADFEADDLVEAVKIISHLNSESALLTCS